MNIIIIDDDTFVCTSLKTILQAEAEITVAAVGHDGTEAVKLYDEHHPDILLMDIQMKPMGGLEAGGIIMAKNPKAKIIFLTTFSDDDYIVKALKLGAKGYLIKQDIETILPALQAVSSGQNVFGSEIVGKLPALLSIERQSSEKSFDYSAHGLNEREWALIRLISSGLSNKEISAKLYLSDGTVRNYITVILDKLNLRDRTQIAVFYYQNEK